MTHPKPTHTTNYPGAEIQGKTSFFESSEMKTKVYEMVEEFGRELAPDLLAAAREDIAYHKRVLHAFNTGQNGGEIDGVARSLHSLSGIGMLLGCSRFASWAQDIERRFESAPNADTELTDFIMELVAMDQEANTLMKQL